ncbi:uncharacterized protein GLRG_02141 [Colletotrichum graminicola M1.001]|uniref:Uncharacterized protein n=1 Tax=Colletotrichum graminicola (strain M1.001 / M2 / FGSC 10212) TaxID=645133 RepID=E3Q7V8_COLGM|nr:uncharacterized protein GLRG_02141 [Colletotrichum graminicola M1.001]EFQ26970.1 hypothetical protein GLRG_02141 [Colletotrichum graminicola M1.001]
MSLARALCLQSSFLDLDDISSSLYMGTEQEVSRLTFGPKGLLKQRGSTDPTEEAWARGARWGSTQQGGVKLDPTRFVQECGELEEASSSVDTDKERAIQKTIQAGFEGYTLIAASGRPEIIMDLERIVIIDKGHGGDSIRRAGELWEPSEDVIATWELRMSA